MCIELHYIYKQCGCLAKTGTWTCGTAENAGREWSTSCVRFKRTEQVLKCGEKTCKEHVGQILREGTPELVESESSEDEKEIFRAPKSGTNGEGQDSAAAVESQDKADAGEAESESDSSEGGHEGGDEGKGEGVGEAMDADVVMGGVDTGVIKFKPKKQKGVIAVGDEEGYGEDEESEQASDMALDDAFRSDSEEEVSSGYDADTEAQSSGSETGERLKEIKEMQESKHTKVNGHGRSLRHVPAGLGASGRGHGKVDLPTTDWRKL